MEEGAWQKGELSGGDTHAKLCIGSKPVQVLGKVKSSGDLSCYKNANFLQLLPFPRATSR